MVGISVILPCYQTGRLLGEAVESIRRQPFKCAAEVIVVDDSSPDAETHEQLDELERLDSVTVIRLDDHSGPQRARNVGLEHAKFDFILVMDSDDCLSLDARTLRRGTYADRAIDVLSRNPNVAFVHSTSWMIGGATGPTDSTYPLDERCIAEKHHASICVIYRRADAIRAGLYDERIQKWQDWSFAAGLLSTRRRDGLSNDIVFFREPYYLYRLHEKGGRISFSTCDELEMVRLTVQRHPDLFAHYFPDLGPGALEQRVLSCKPRFADTLSYITRRNPRSLPRWLQRRLIERLTSARHLGT
jgi:glycosyltransferase involved in cell wall biosynthesis